MVDYHLPEIPHVWPLPRLKGLNYSTVPSLPLISNKSSECSCCSRNKPAKIQSILHHVLWINFMQEETKLFTWHSLTGNAVILKMVFTDISKISLNFCANLSREPSSCLVAHDAPVTPPTCGLQCSSIQLKTQADSSWKLPTDTELLKDWKRESMMLWKTLNFSWSDTWFSPCCGLFWWALTMCS